MHGWPHLASCSDSFEDFEDVLFVVGGQRLPAHSQYLASHSKLMQTLLRDSQAFSRDQPLVLDQQLQGFSPEDLQTFINHVYLSSLIKSSAEALALLRVADLFDASKLMGVAVSYLETASGDDMFSTNEGIVRWLLLAERFDMPAFLKKCANHAAIHYQDVSADPSFNQLGVAALKAVLKSVHMLTCLNPLLNTSEERDHLQKTQSYTCKSFTKGQTETRHGTVQCENSCRGHRARWTWQLERQVWQLNGNPVIAAKSPTHKCVGVG